MGLESKINYILNKNPGVKKKIKRIYQKIVCAFSNHPKATGNIKRVSPKNDGKEYFFGYYDKSPWDINDRYMLCLRANNTWDDVSPKEKADIILIDTNKKYDDPQRTKKIAETSTWNVQQGCMLQWLGSDFSERIIYNDFRDGRYVSVILNISTKEERIINAPVYTVSADGKTALTLDFSRLYNLRPGYGYYNESEKTKNIALPDATAVWKINLETGEVTELFTYKDFARFQPRPEMKEKGSVHKVNHLMLSPNGQRCMVLYRWFVGKRKYTRLITFNIDGSDMYVLSDDDMVSHCFWKDDKYILAFENKKKFGIGYYIMEDRTQKYRQCWRELTGDGHPSYSHDGKMIVTDSYPDRARIQYIRIMKDENSNPVTVAKVFSPFKYDNDTRCDLHPRWNRAGNKICFDSVFEGHRGLYYVELNKTSHIKAKVVFMLTSCKKTGPTQQMLNIIDNLDKSKFEPVLLTIYPEVTDGTSQLYKFQKVCKHIFVPVSKKDILLQRYKNLLNALENIKPDVIHSLGVFPNYAICKIKKYPQIITVRNYVWDDYPAKFGRIKGTMLAELDIYAMKHSAMTVACSESLSKIYKEKLNLNYGFIRNGVDLDNYKQVTSKEKINLRKKFGIPQDAFVFVYSGQIIERKNQEFLLEVFDRTFSEPKVILMLLGDGADYAALSSKYGGKPNIIFTGNVTNVCEYLNASDVYVSTSKSEGMPNGVLEAMATGLPVILSDIEQHREIFDVDNRIGYLYKQEDKNNLSEIMKSILSMNISEISEFSYNSAHNNFDAKMNCRQYENMYSTLVEKNM